MNGKCFYCDEPAVRYCDFNIGGPIGSYARIGLVSDNKFYACYDIEKMPFTCDMPMCVDHAKHIGNIFMPGDIEQIDHCPEHVGCDETVGCPCTEEESNVIRRDIRAKARRKIIREAAQ